MSEEVVKKDMCDLTHENLKSEIEGVKHQTSTNTTDIVDLKLNNATLTAILKQLTDKKSFWETELGRKIVTWGFWLLAVIVFVAIGKDYIDKIPK